MPNGRSRKPVTSVRNRTELLLHDQRSAVPQTCINGSADRSAQSRERCLPEEPRRTLPLRIGGEIDAGFGRGYFEGLRSLLEQYPQHFQALVTLAEGSAPVASLSSIDFLKHCWFLDADGRIKSDVRAVLLSALQVTPEGAVLTNPFRLETSDQARDLERQEADGYRRLLRRLGTEGKDKGRSI